MSRREAGNWARWLQVHLFVFAKRQTLFFRQNETEQEIPLNFFAIFHSFLSFEVYPPVISRQ